MAPEFSLRIGRFSWRAAPSPSIGWISPLGEAGYGDVFERVVDGRRDRTAIIEAECNASYTFSELDPAADRIAYRAGVSMQTRQGFATKTVLPFSLASLGLIKAGKPVLFNRFETPRDIIRLAEHYGIGIFQVASQVFHVPEKQKV
uniref:Uncharacterized protein n=1 Tax=Candidatus Kentrum sp. TC TaxID=2126339 RepID=A0A451ABG3_9GAMM|nr:MAG: hypothetical protein BECKTC1821F_GA0114240_10933 [Candidatus Kentron sp. TC]